MVRIIGGSRKGRKLVEWEQEGIRPMRDFVRSAL
ncbi:RsmD family RNA methyltransferase, partial [Candidatus Bipolaricaulota bacterium]|nr:RsmD family RNA methyltransferase [Candidatus Bipolaricaulota bacterium]